MHRKGLIKLEGKSFDLEVTGTLSITAATFVAGLNVYLAKIILSLNPLFLTALTLTSAGLILFVVNVFLGKIFEVFIQCRKYFLKLLWVGIIGTSIPMSMVFYGLSLSPISNAFLLQIEAVYSIILSHILLREKIGIQQIFLSLSSFLGIFLITSEGTLRGLSAGDLLFLLAPFFFQCAHIVAKNLMQTINPLMVVTFRLLIGGLTLFLALIPLGSNPLEVITGIPAQNAAMISCLSIGYAVGNSLWYYGVKNVNLSKATAIMITYPMISMILAIFTLGEKLSIIKGIGITIVFFSVLRLSLLRTVQE